MTVRGPIVGVSAVLLRADRVLVGRRRGSHGAGTWAFPGGKVDPGEDPATAVARELAEETGLVAVEVRPITWTSDVIESGDERWHFVTLHHLVVASPGDPQTREPDKVEGWRWVALDAIPEPRFAPAASLLASARWPPAPHR
jgi:8-oxo-dGTP diphosphatase